MKTYATQYATLTVDYDKPVDGYPNNNIDRSKEQEGTEAAISAVNAAIIDMGCVGGFHRPDDGELSEIAQRIFDTIVGTAENGGYTVSAKRIKQISFDNGMHYFDANEANDALLTEHGKTLENDYWWENITQMMDDDAREEAHSNVAPCTNEEFLAEYLKLAPDDIIIG